MMQESTKVSSRVKIGSCILMHAAVLVRQLQVDGVKYLVQWEYSV